MPDDRWGGVESALGGALAGQPLVALPALFSNPLAVREEAAVPALASASRESSVDAMPMLSRMPIWVEPISGYRTPMCQAISVAGSHIYDWVGAHPNSFPPIVINITDGLVTDSPYEGADLTEWAQRLVSIETNDGPLLLLNIFLSAAGQTEVLFPSSANQLPEPGPDLFAISSPLRRPWWPTPGRPAAHAAGGPRFCLQCRTIKPGQVPGDRHEGRRYPRSLRSGDVGPISVLCPGKGGQRGMEWEDGAGASRVARGTASTPASSWSTVPPRPTTRCAGWRSW